MQGQGQGGARGASARGAPHPAAGGPAGGSAPGLWKTLHGCRPGRRPEFRRGSRGGRHKARFVLRSPGAGTNGLAAAEVIRQAEPGVRPAEGPPGRPAGFACGAQQAAAPRQVVALLRDSVYPSVQLGRSVLPCPPLWATVKLKYRSHVAAAGSAAGDGDIGDPQPFHRKQALLGLCGRQDQGEKVEASVICNTVSCVWKADRRLLVPFQPRTGDLS